MRKLFTLLALFLASVGLAQTPNPPSSFQTSTTWIKPSIAGLHVAGNRVLNSSGQEVLLRGVNIAGASYNCQAGNGTPTFDGPTDQTSINAMLAWGINTVRIPVNELCWLGVNGFPSNGISAATYQSQLATYIALLNSNGIVADIDLQFSSPDTNPAQNNQEMPDTAHTSTFWASVANAYKTNPAVIFGVFNEPRPDGANDSTAAWTCLRDGGTCSGISYTTVGMTSLVSTIRGTGATNIIVMPGVSYANSLSQWMTYLYPTDSTHQLIAEWHTYAYQTCSPQTCWNSQILPVTNSVPVLAGELGETDCGSTFINEQMDWLDIYHGGYLGWAWFTGSCTGFPSLISNYDGTPTGFGVGLRNHLLGVTGQQIPAPPTVPFFSTTFPVGIAVGRSTNYTAADATVYYSDVNNSNAGLTTNLTQGPYTPYTTADTITGTSDPTLYQTGRIGAYGYWYANVPNGTYNVSLGFAYNSTYNFGTDLSTDPYGQDQDIQGQTSGTCMGTYFPAAGSAAATYMDYTDGVHNGLVGGSGYTNGIYANITLTGGSGTGAKAKIYVTGGAVTGEVTTTQGSGYIVGDVLTGSVPGGSGWSMTVWQLGSCPGAGITDRTIPVVDTAYVNTYTVPVYNQQISILSGASFGGGRTAVLSSIKIAQVSTGSPPAVPANFTGVVSGTNINLSWTASSGAQYYKLLRATSSLGAYRPIGVPETNSFSDTTTVHGTTYCYYAEAVSGAGYSANSTQFCATP